MYMCVCVSSYIYVGVDTASCGAAMHAWRSSSVRTQRADRSQVLIRVLASCCTLYMRNNILANAQFDHAMCIYRFDRSSSLG